MDEILNEYADKFNENFPIVSFMGTPEDEIIKIVRNCIDKNKPYEMNYEEGVLY